ncbi:MAG TPA: ATP-dependent DNA helicase RecG [Candidatus Humimicrobiaceae bacterium]|nr:ATP-dependent DNA helicase RecG [Candidatus Humimicrobiaceae bacterium]
MDLSASLEKIPRVGPQYQKRLKRLGIKTVGQLLFHFPHRYEDFSNVIPIAEVKKGETVSVQGKILDIKNIRTFRKRMVLTQALVDDDSGKLQVIWFNQPYLINNFKKGDFLFLAGKMNQSKNGRYLSSPAYEKVSDELRFKNSDLIHTGRLVPVYPETEGLSSRWLRFIIKPLLGQLKDEIHDPLPDYLIKKYNFLAFNEAIWQIHFPDSLKLAQESKKRFVFEELFSLSLFVLRERVKLAKEKSANVPLSLSLIKQLVKNLPFQLTDDQKKASWQILNDLERSFPMNRLLQGDVGSGKTVVAAMAALNTAKAGYQTALLAPTEILTQQHYQTFNSLLKKYKISIGLITGKENKFKNKKIKRKELLEKAKTGEVDILIGTHALVQKEVKFGKLALVIVDEQHRFGVEQRAGLCQQKELIPHFLSMTATPIPRTLSLTIYGDLDLSLIKELPKGRKKVITEIISPEKRNKAYDFVREQIKEGRQVFVICPRIEPPATFQENDFNQINLEKSNRGWAEVKAVKEEHEKLAKKIFPEFKVALLHGRMKNEEKEKTMKKFKEGKIDILVSTSVIEVGIDIANATVMLIEGANKFGLAQLHQFRGRVGRGKKQSFCFLMTDFPSQKTNQRLRALIKCENGFELAEKDLEIRGPGDFIGQRQWGIPNIAMDALKDISLVEETRKEAKEVLEKDSQLKKYPLLREKLKEFRENIHLE